MQRLTRVAFVGSKRVRDWWGEGVDERFQKPRWSWTTCNLELFRTIKKNSSLYENESTKNFVQLKKLCNPRPLSQTCTREIALKAPPISIFLVCDPTFRDLRNRRRHRTLHFVPNWMQTKCCCFDPNKISSSPMGDERFTGVRTIVSCLKYSQR